MKASSTSDHLLPSGPHPETLALTPSAHVSGLQQFLATEWDDGTVQSAESACLSDTHWTLVGRQAYQSSELEDGSKGAFPTNGAKGQAERANICGLDSRRACQFRLPQPVPSMLIPSPPHCHRSNHFRSHVIGRKQVPGLGWSNRPEM